uniref:Haloacid dehalogenase like hydrolase domain containing 5 n=1 Tax=Sinocyclocheilus grahami TaxID=75366 RepID=A0A672RWG5_SINGR
MFLVCLESIYKKITGCELKYEALIGKPSVVTYNYAELLIRKQAEQLVIDLISVSILICIYCHFIAVVLFGEPVRWETNLQLITDVLLTNGRPGNPVTSLHYPHIPVLACNMDLLWMAEAKNPRSVDNPMADIYGANLYNRYLKAMHHTRAQVQAQGGSSSQVTSDLQCCSSILVCTGVYNHDQQDLPSDPEQTVTEQQIFHGHRDFRFDPSLTQPSFVVHDVRDGVELVFQLEGWSLQ